MGLEGNEFVDWVEGRLELSGEGVNNLLKQVPLGELRKALKQLEHARRNAEDNTKADPSRPVRADLFVLLGQITRAEDGSTEFADTARRIAAKYSELLRLEAERDIFYRARRLVNSINYEISTRPVRTVNAIDASKQATLEAELRATRDRQSEAEYAALLAEGRKSKTLQQAYANGDFIPIDESQERGLKSNTGHRLGARS